MASKTDFFYWGGPVYCNTATEFVRWRRPTVTFCNALAGTDNSAWFYANMSGGPEPPIYKLLRKANMDPAQVGSVGLASFSAGGQVINPTLEDPASCKRVDFVYLADSCFLGAGATKPHKGYLAFAIRALKREAMMVITSKGKPGDIHYSYDGKNYDLTSGSQCVSLLWNAATAAVSVKERVPQIPADMKPPVRARQRGYLIWLDYEDTEEHGYHATKLPPHIFDFYAAPWMADKKSFRGAIPAEQQKWVAGLAGLAAGAYAASHVTRRTGWPKP